MSASPYIFEHRGVQVTDVDPGEIGWEDMVLGGMLFCLDCEQIVAPDLHDYWHRTGRPAIHGLRSGEVGEAM